jgi:demethylmenaquinone methyltransferase/2-methoxy-6-polyprenyl-1,4-benzoquinol methylase
MTPFLLSYQTHSGISREMNIEAFANSKIGNFIVKVAGAALESRLRYRLSGPMKILQGADIQPGQTVLEVGCGTGFHTVSAAQMIGDQGCLVAMDVLLDYIEQVSKKIQAAELKNVRILKRDALDTGLDAASIDTVLLFSAIPSPTLPLNRLLPEMHRVLKPEGTLAVTTFPWVPRSIRRSGLFTYISKRNGVYNFRRCQAGR